MSNATIRACDYGFEFDYNSRVYRVWRDKLGRIVYKCQSVIELPNGRKTRASFPRRVDQCVRAGSVFCDLLFSCASLIEESDCAGYAS